MSTPLTKSYVSTLNPDRNPNAMVIFKDIFDETRKTRREGLLVNLDTGERVTNLSLLEKGDNYAKGLIALGLTPGVDNIMVVGCASFETLAIFVAASELGFGFSNLGLSPPRDKSVSLFLPMVTPKVVITGEGAGGHNFDALVSLFDADETQPSSDALPFVEHIFYDSSYKNRQPSHKFMQTLHKLVELGNSVTDEQLAEAKGKVKPDFMLQFLYTSGSTGTPKCASRSQTSLAATVAYATRNEYTRLCVNMAVYPAVGYGQLIYSLAGLNKKLVMVNETYPEQDEINTGKILTQSIIDERIDVLSVGMRTLMCIVDYLRYNQITLPHPMKLVFYNGQRVSKEFKEHSKQLLKGDQMSAYGTTEAYYIGRTAMGDSPEAILSREEARLYLDPNRKMRIVNEKEEIVEIGEVGEIQVKTFSAITEYRNNREKTKTLFTADGFQRTGDAGVMFSDGSIKVIGRITGNELFKVLLIKEYAGPIEDIISQHPDIYLVHVVSAKESDWIGDELAYCICMKNPSDRISEEDLLDFCQAKGLNPRQRPARVIYFDKVPTIGEKTNRLKLIEDVRAMVAKDDMLGKCQWFIREENAGKKDSNCDS